jgi:hypothetical protein
VGNATASVAARDALLGALAVDTEIPAAQNASFLSEIARKKSNSAPQVFGDLLALNPHEAFHQYSRTAAHHCFFHSPLAICKMGFCAHA